MMSVSLSALQATGFVSHMLPANGRRRPSAAVARTSAAQSRNCCVLISAAKGRAWGRGEEITDQRNSKLVEESEELHRQLFGDLNPYLEAKAAAKYIPGIHHVGTWEAAFTPPSGKPPAGFAAAFEHSKVHEATQAVQQAAGMSLLRCNVRCCCVGWCWAAVSQFWCCAADLPWLLVGCSNSCAAPGFTCRISGGLTRWGLTVDSMREEECREAAEAAAAEAEMAAEAAVEAGDSEGEAAAAPLVVARPTALPDDGLMLKFHQLLTELECKTATVKASTCNEVRAQSGG